MCDAHYTHGLHLADLSHLHSYYISYFTPSLISATESWHSARPAEWRLPTANVIVYIFNNKRQETRQRSAWTYLPSEMEQIKLTLDRSEKEFMITAIQGVFKLFRDILAGDRFSLSEQEHCSKRFQAFFKSNCGCGRGGWLINTSSPLRKCRYRGYGKN